MAWGGEALVTREPIRAGAAWHSDGEVGGYARDGNRRYLVTMNNTEPKICTIGGKWRRYVIARGALEPDTQRQYWDGAKWILERRVARLYAHLTAAREDLKKVSATG